MNILYKYLIFKYNVQIFLFKNSINQKSPVQQYSCYMVK